MQLARLGWWLWKDQSAAQPLARLLPPPRSQTFPALHLLELPFD